MITIVTEPAVLGNVLAREMGFCLPYESNFCSLKQVFEILNLSLF